MQTYSIHPDQQAILTDSEQALERIDQRQTFHDWVRVGRGVTMLREIAMTRGGTDDIDSHAYRQALGAVKRDYPKLAKLNKTEASHAVWLWDHHVELEAWHRSLTPNQARALNHPSTIWRKNPLGEYREKKVRTTRAQAADVIKDAANLLTEAKDRFETATAINPGLDLSNPEMIEASGQILVDYYGARDTAALLCAAAPRTGLFVFTPDSPPQTVAQTVYNWLPVSQRQDFATTFARLLAADPDAHKLRPRSRKTKPQ